MSCKITYKTYFAFHPSIYDLLELPLTKLFTHLTRFAKFCLLWEKRNYNILWFLKKTDSEFSPNLLNDKI